jgi:hypothetical protein
MLFNRQIYFSYELPVSVLCWVFSVQGSGVVPFCTDLSILEQFPTIINCCTSFARWQTKGRRRSDKDNNDHFPKNVLHTPRQLRTIGRDLAEGSAASTTKETSKKKACGIGASSAGGESDVRLSRRAIFTKVNCVIQVLESELISCHGPTSRSQLFDAL